MLTTYFLLTAATATVSLTWRMLKQDHPALKRFLHKLPLVGEALLCGFCATLWFSLAAVLIVNPFPGYIVPFLFSFGAITSIVGLLFNWFAVSASVLFVRSAIVVLLEAGAVLRHMHTANH